MHRVGSGTIVPEDPPVVLSRAAVGGKKEAEGPLGSQLDQTFDNARLNDGSWEEAESLLQKEALTLALDKAGLAPERLDLLFAGDLVNQCTASHFGLRDFHVPFLGQYGACSTMSQTLLMAALAVGSGAADHAAAVTSSHFCTAERQFRTPLEYGAQRAPTAQWTATAAGCVLLGRRRDAPAARVRVTGLLPGRMVDLGVKDGANMGGAMAPAAADSILRFLEDTGAAPSDFDGIFTGDLGVVGTRLLLRVAGENGRDLSAVHRDCGLLLFDRDRQDVHAGGSGCGCSAAVLCAHILPGLERGLLRRVLFCATGALLSTTSQQQGESIPGICHVVELRSSV